MPVHMVETINRLSRVQRQLLQDLGREPTPEEIARELEVTPEQVREIQKIAQEPVSLETPGGRGGRLASSATSSRTARPSTRGWWCRTLMQQRGARRRARQTLTHRERRVLELRFGLRGEEPRTLEEVGQSFGVTRERIRQIEAKTLNKLKAIRESARLRDFLE